MDSCAQAVDEDAQLGAAIWSQPMKAGTRRAAAPRVLLRLNAGKSHVQETQRRLEGALRAHMTCEQAGVYGGD
jgi:hypothetical protein